MIQQYGSVAFVLDPPLLCATCPHLLFPLDEQDVAKAEVHHIDERCTLAVVHVCCHPESVNRVRLVVSGFNVRDITGGAVWVVVTLPTETDTGGLNRETVIFMS